MLQRGTRRKMAATAAAAALALTAAACGGDDGSGGDDGGAVTIWMSLDQSVVDGIDKQMQIAAEEAGIEVNIERVDGIDKLIKTKIQAGDTPDIALLPQPGVVASVVELGAAFPLDDVLDTDELESHMVAGALDAGQGRRPALRPADLDERQVAHLLPQEGVRGGGLPAAREPRRADRARRPDQVRRRHPLVPDHGVR